MRISPRALSCSRLTSVGASSSSVPDERLQARQAVLLLLQRECQELVEDFAGFGSRAGRERLRTPAAGTENTPHRNRVPAARPCASRSTSLRRRTMPPAQRLLPQPRVRRAQRPCRSPRRAASANSCLFVEIEQRALQERCQRQVVLRQQRRSGRAPSGPAPRCGFGQHQPVGAGHREIAALLQGARQRMDERRRACAPAR
jgi:hypothetical protein